MASIGIIGAGLMGRLIAIKLIQQGIAFTLIDEDPDWGPQSCAFAAAGMLAPWSEMDSASRIIFDLGQRSLQLWPEVVTLLKDIFFEIKGSLVVVHSRDRSELDHFQRRLGQQIQESGQNYRVDAQKIDELEPYLDRRFHDAFYFSQEGQISPRDFIKQSTRFLRDSGVEMVTARVTTIAPTGRVCTTEGEFFFNRVIDTRGLGARGDLSELRGVRGEICLVRAPDVHFNRPIRLLHPRYPLYIVPRPDYHYVVGASVVESEDRGPVTIQSLMELLSAAYALSPAFSEARLIDTWTQCRPAFENHLPRVEVKGQVISVNGLFRHGFLTGPALAEAVFTYIMEEKWKLPTVLFRDDFKSIRVEK